MERDNCEVEFDGIRVWCQEKLIGHDKYRYFSPHWEFPFASVDKWDEGDRRCRARTCGATFDLPMDFTHGDVVAWALGHIRDNEPKYYACLKWVR